MSNRPNSYPLDASKERHVASLYENFPTNTIVVDKLGSRFEISIYAGSQRAKITVSVDLPTGFPISAPQFKVLNPTTLQHPWVISAPSPISGISFFSKKQSANQLLIVGHPALLSADGWTNTKLIGLIVKDIEIEFNRRIPTGLSGSSTFTEYAGVKSDSLSTSSRLAINQPPSYMEQSVPASGTVDNFNPESSQSTIASSDERIVNSSTAAQSLASNVTKITSSVEQDSIMLFPELDSLTFGGLREVSESNAKFESFFESTSAAKRLLSSNNEMIEELISQACKNLQILHNVEDLKQQLIESVGILKLEDAEFEQLIQKNKATLRPFTGSGICDGFQKLISQHEDMALKALEDFKSGRIDSFNFINIFSMERFSALNLKAHMLKFRQILSEDSEK